MHDLTVLVPSRGRPDNIRRLATAFAETCTADTLLVVCVDDDDPTLAAYRALPPETFALRVGPRLRLGGTLNDQAPQFASDTKAIGFMGDDHLPRTHGWDTQVCAALAALGTGEVYGNDLNHGEALPTAVFMTSDIVTKLGYMVPPGMVHLYLDNFWLALGQALNAITYLPDVVIEHLHPVFNKATPDALYAEVNAPELYAADSARFRDYVDHQLATDVERIRG